MTDSHAGAPKDELVAAEQLLASSAPGAISGIFVAERLGEDARLVEPPLSSPDAPAISPVASLILHPAVGAVNPNLGAYMLLSEWVGQAVAARGVELSTGFWINHLVGRHSRDSMLCAIASLGRALSAGHAKDPVASIRASVTPDVLPYLDQALGRPIPRQFLCRQGLLLAAKAVLRANVDDDSESGLPPLLAATLLSQAVLDEVPDMPAPSGDDLYPSMDAALGADVASNWLFQSTTEAVSAMDETRRLWLEYPPRADAALDQAPHELFAQASGGMGIQDLVELGLMLWVTISTAEHFEVPYLDHWEHFPFDPVFLAAALEFIAATPEGLVEKMDKGGGGEWDVLAFETSPVALLPGRPPVVLDEILLWRRFADGPFYAVLDHQRAIGGLASSGAWTKAYGDMVEQASHAAIKRLAVPLIPTGLAYWDGDAVKLAFGGKAGAKGKTADSVLLYGDTAVCLEIVTHGPTVATRLKADPVGFADDMEKQLWQKAEQLHATANDLLDDDRRLTGWPQQATRRIRPLLVQGRAFPMMPLVHAYIESGLRARALLRRGGITTLLVVDLDELEMLLAVAEATHKTLPVLLDEWERGPHRGWAVKNHLLDAYSDLGAKLRPATVTEGIEEMLHALEERAKTAAQGETDG